jgi:hypothetical protein
MQSVLLDAAGRDGPRGRPARRDPATARARHLGITSVYLRRIDSSEIISTVHGRPSPTISATAGLQVRR